MDVLTSVAQPSGDATINTTATARFRFFWRVHFWAAMVTTPILLFAAVTGLLYVFTPQIEAWQHEKLDVVQVSGTHLSLDAQVAAARAANPTLTMRMIVPAYGATQSTQVIFGAAKKGGEAMPAIAPLMSAHNAVMDDHAEYKLGMQLKTPDIRAPSTPISSGHGMPDGKITYINPYTGAVLGTHDEMDRFNNWARKLHSTALQGDDWRWVLELAASWLLVMVCTGLYLWWPKSKAAGGRGLTAIVPGAGGGISGRLKWREWHSFIGLIASAMLLIIVLTGLTWSKYTGDNFRDVLKATGQAAPRAPANLVSTPLSNFGGALSIAGVYAKAQALAPAIRLQLTSPRNGSDVWRVGNFDRSQPTARVQLFLDQYTGNALFQAGWDALPFGAMATGVGIPFHRGEFGWWNQALLVFAALATIFSVISGFVMWWQRRPAKSLAAPAPKISWRHVRAMPLWLWPLAAVLGWIMPVFGISLALFIAIEIAQLTFRRNP